MFIDQVSFHSVKDLKIGHILGSGCYNDIVELIDVRNEQSRIRDHDTNSSGSRRKLAVTPFREPEQQKSQNKKYVVKKLRGDLSSSSRSDGALALAMEANILQRLSHPNIISMHYMGTNQGDPDFFIVIERVDIDLTRQIQLWKGEEARVRLSKKTTRASNKDQLESRFYDRMSIAYQVASALAYLHENMVLFRDLKPQNIGLDKDNNAKIFDFGLSKELSEDIKVKNDPGYDKYIATRNTGTPRYMAPEVFAGITYGLPVDIYSYSLSMWELMSLSLSFDNLSSLQDLHVQAHKKKRRPHINGHWPKELRRIIQDGWHHDASKRPCAMELCEELQLCMRRRVLSQPRTASINRCLS